MSYFITSIVYLPDHPDEKYNRPYNTNRTFGHFGSLRRAKQAVKDNECNLQECLYNYLVIEKMNFGIHTLSESEVWYEWDNQNSKWIKIKKPEWSKKYCCWAF